MITDKVQMFTAITLGVFLVSGLGILPFNDAYAASTLYMISKEPGQPPNPSQLWTVNANTGVATPLPNQVGFDACTAIDFHPVTSVLYAACEITSQDNNRLITINIGTGIGTDVGANGGTPNYGDLSFRPSDSSLFALQTGSADIGSMNLLSGTFTSNGNTGQPPNGGHGIAFAPSGTLYHITADNFIIPAPDTVNTINENTGNTVEGPFVGYLAPLAEDDRTTAMDFEPFTGLMWAAIKQGPGSSAPTYLTTIDPTTGSMGARVLITSDGDNAIIGVDGIAFFEEILVAGELLPIDSKALFLAGIQSIAMWMIPIGISSIVAGAYLTRNRWS